MEMTLVKMFEIPFFQEWWIKCCSSSYVITLEKAGHFIGLPRNQLPKLRCLLKWITVNFKRKIHLCLLCTAIITNILQIMTCFKWSLLILKKILIGLVLNICSSLLLYSAYTLLEMNPADENRTHPQQAFMWNFTFFRRIFKHNLAKIWSWVKSPCKSCKESWWFLLEGGSEIGTHVPICMIYLFTYFFEDYHSDNFNDYTFSNEVGDETLFVFSSKCRIVFYETTRIHSTEVSWHSKFLSNMLQT